MKSRQLALALVAAIADQKGLDLRVLHLGGIGGFTDYFVLASGTSDRHVRALADAVSESARGLGERALGVEGEERARWILLDFGDVVVHAFQEEAREYYALERLWGEAESLDLEDAVESADEALPGGRR